MTVTGRALGYIVHFTGAMALLDPADLDLIDVGPEGEDEPTWEDAALCAQSDPELWFPEKGGSVREAKRLCAACPVRAECLQAALDRDERFGVWGGLTEKERRGLRLGPVTDAERDDVAGSAA